MRVYLPMTVSDLAALRAQGEVGPAPLRAHAVTAALREWYVEGDLEELEYAASAEAGAASLRRIAADPTAPRRRIVVSADVADDDVRSTGGGERSRVQLVVTVPLSAVASIHIDDADAHADVAAAADALAAADEGDEDAQFVVDGADGHELLWYDVTELDDVIALLRDAVR